jgi:cytoskeletal protein CcmA (bactofilin family)
MVKQNRSDLKINGNGKISGGLYNDVLINGIGKVNGDLDCINFKCNGDSDVNGNLKASSTRINGTTDITGNLRSDEIKISGFSEIAGGVKAKQVRIEGQVNIGESMTADEIMIRGAAKIKGDCNSETFESHGAFTVDGLLNSGTVDVKLYGPCKAREIGGERITVKKGNAFILRDLIKAIFTTLDISNRLSSDVIEGDDISLECTKAKVVRGNNVTIGEGCDIGLVEYKKTFQQSDSSTVNEKKKI